VFGAMNVVGGYVVTDRMLEMFKAKPAAAQPTTGEPISGQPTTGEKV
jgi:NAD(P) transhydrogenase subunit alpha